MNVQSKPIPINQGRDSRFRRRNNRFSVQRTQSQRNTEIPQPRYPSPPEGSPPPIAGFPRGNGEFQRCSLSPPTQSPTEIFVLGPAFPTGPPPQENVNAFAHHQYVELRDETPSPPVGYSATSMHGYAGSPPYPMPLSNEYSASFNPSPPQYQEAGYPQVAYRQQVYTNTTQFHAYWPRNQMSPPNLLTFFPTNPPAPQIVPAGFDDCYCLPPAPRREEYFANNFQSLTPLPMPMPFVGPSFSGMMPEVAEPPPMPVVEDNDNANGRPWCGVQKRRTGGRKKNVGGDNQVMEISEEENQRLGNRRRSSSNPAISYPCCSFCKSNRETRQFYESHVLKNDDGVTSCPVLRKYTCPICKAVGDNAHTLKYCPENEDGERERSMSWSSQKSALMKKRNSRGIIGAYRYG